jgi:hypothetical protein
VYDISRRLFSRILNYMLDFKCSSFKINAVLELNSLTLYKHAEKCGWESLEKLQFGREGNIKTNIWDTDC